MDNETLPTTPDEWEAWLSSKADEFGLTGKHAFSREGDSFRYEFHFFKQLCETVPAFEERREQRADEIWEEIASREAERLEDVEYALPKLKAHIAELSIAQANDPSLDGDTLLGTLIANLREGCQALVERVEQLKGIKLAEHSPANAPRMMNAMEDIGLCFKVLSADVLTDEALRGHDLHGDLIKLAHEWGAVAERAILLKTEP